MGTELFSNNSGYLFRGPSGRIVGGFVLCSLTLSACALANPDSVSNSSEPDRSRSELNRPSEERPVGDQFPAVRSIRLFGRKVLVDSFERSPSPSGSRSRRGGLPFHGISFAKAKGICQRAGGRLCTVREWQRACQLARRNEESCSRVHSRLPSGARCAHGGLQDMSSNFAEWAVRGPARRPAIVGRGSGCDDFRLEAGSAPGQDVSVRCCR